ncbi:hypothetical protein [Methylobacterium sp. ID0610]|uniref:hypothetical protein n=1 Tax=Methylobacterium carpenticola TaxID=3344827 RepID=UPI0036C6C2A5
MELAEKHRSDHRVDIGEGVSAYLAEVKAHAAGLRSKVDGARFLSAVRQQIRIAIPTSRIARDAIAKDAGSARRLSTLTLITDRL